MTIELLRPLWVAPMNFLGDCVRRMLGAGPEWKMHLRLARRLVDKQSWFMIPLVSGTQSPIFDAIDYLVQKHDRDSISRLELLFEHYTKSTLTLHEERLHSGTIAYIYGPGDYMPLNVQLAATKALLALYPYRASREFVGRMLAADNMRRLDEHTIRALLAYAITTRMDLAGDLLTSALAHVSAIQREQQRRSDAILRREAT